MKTLRLLFTPKCNRSCEGCCNKQWDLDTLEQVEHFNYEEIILTGGEPLLYVKELIGVIRVIRRISSAKIYVYTAMLPSSNNKALYEIMPYVDGITLTLHEQIDSDRFNHVLYSLENDPNVIRDFSDKSLRLNVFSGIKVSSYFKSISLWKIKDEIEWIKDCPLPVNEEFRRL